MGTPNRKPSDQATRRRISDDMASALGTICRSWNAATNAASARGYQSGGDGSPLVMTSTVADPTGNAAGNPDPADDWLKRARVIVLWLLSSSAGGERQLTGPFNPPAWEGALR